MYITEMPYAGCCVSSGTISGAATDLPVSVARLAESIAGIICDTGLFSGLEPEGIRNNGKRRKGVRRTTEV